jgi:hypothetical protein
VSEGWKRPWEIAQPPERFLQAFEQAGEALGAGDVGEVDPTTGERKC